MVLRRIIWSAIVLSTLIYWLIVLVIAGQPAQPFDDSIRQPLVIALYVVALATFFLSFFMSNLVARKSAHTAFIVRLALTEAVAIYGLLAAFLQHDWRLYAAPWIVAMIGFLGAWPGSEPDVTAEPARRF